MQHPLSFPESGWITSTGDWTDLDAAIAQAVAAAPTGVMSVLFSGDMLAAVLNRVGTQLGAIPWATITQDPQFGVKVTNPAYLAHVVRFDWGGKKAVRQRFDARFTSLWGQPSEVATSFRRCSISTHAYSRAAPCNRSSIG